MTADRLIRRTLLEGLPAASLFGMCGIVIGMKQLALASLVPLAVWAIASFRVARNLREESDASVGGALAVGVGHTAAHLFRGYFRLGLWRGRGLYDVAATVGLALGVWWWLCSEVIQDAAYRDTARYLSYAALALFVGGIWLRFKTRKTAYRLFEDVFLTLDSWAHKRCRTNEASYEYAIATHLEQNDCHVEQGVRLDSGREADIVVRPKSHRGVWDYRDVMIEMKAHMTKTTERDRAMGQIETYAREWPGSMILMICGRYREDLVRPIQEKIDAMRAQKLPVALVIKGRAV